MSGELADVTIDVRDMLCAQALACLARSAAHLPRGSQAAVLYTADDVKQDVVVWAREQGFVVREAVSGRLSLERVR